MDYIAINLDNFSEADKKALLDIIKGKKTQIYIAYEITEAYYYYTWNEEELKYNYPDYSKEQIISALERAMENETSMTSSNLSEYMLEFYL